MDLETVRCNHLATKALQFGRHFIVNKSISANFYVEQMSGSDFYGYSPNSCQEPSTRKTTQCQIHDGAGQGIVSLWFTFCAAWITVQSLIPIHPKDIIVFTKVSDRPTNTDVKYMISLFLCFFCAFRLILDSDRLTGYDRQERGKA